MNGQNKDANFDYAAPYRDGTVVTLATLTVDSKVDKSSLLETLLPFWRLASQCTEEDQYILAQIHTNVVYHYITNEQLRIERDTIMSRLRQEEADRCHGGDVGKLYLHYPHKEVDKECPARMSFYLRFCDYDLEVYDRAFRKANPLHPNYSSTVDEMFHVESLLHSIEAMRKKLVRRILI